MAQSSSKFQIEITEQTNCFKGIIPNANYLIQEGGLNKARAARSTVTGIGASTCITNSNASFILHVRDRSGYPVPGAEQALQVMFFYNGEQQNSKMYSSSQKKWVRCNSCSSTP